MKRDSMRSLFILIIISCINPTLSQTNELGIFVGGSLFHGDVGYQNAEYSVLDSRPVLGIHLKRNFNYHFGVMFSISKGSLFADDMSSGDAFIQLRGLHFKSKITEFGLLFEFNFKPYLSYDNDHNHSPFIFSGITKFYFNPQAQYSDGNWYNLRPLSTEGQESDLYPSRDFYKLNGIAIPIGIGYKVNIYEFLTLSFNLGWRLTFTDYIDDVSTTYVESTLLSDLTSELMDPSEYHFPSGFQRGNPYNKDKYGFFGLSILYSIKDPNNGCNDIIY